MYYGTEQGLSSDQNEDLSDSKYAHGGSAIRESLWQTGYDKTTWQYQFIKLLNKARKQAKIDVGGINHTIQNSTEQTLVFTRGESVWVYVNNIGASSKAEKEKDDDASPANVVYCPGPPAQAGKKWRNILSTANDFQEEVNFDENGCYVAVNDEPKVLVAETDQF